MTLTPLLTAAPAIQIHVAAAVAAIALSLVQFAGAKGTRRHRCLGWAWAGTMLVLAATGLFIHEVRTIGAFSPVHLLSLLVLFTLPWAIWAARRGRVEAHRRAVAGLVGGGLVVAGALTLLPGRLMNAMLFGL